MNSTVLFVDDQSDFIKLLETKLEAEKYDKLFCTNPYEAWDIIRKQDIDVLISDINMPGMDGFELFRECMNHFPEIVRVALTSMNSPGIILDALNNDVVHRYFSKPWKVDDNGKEQIRKLLDLRSQLIEKIDRNLINKALSRVRAGIKIVRCENAGSRAIAPLTDRYTLISEL